VSVGTYAGPAVEEGADRSRVQITAVGGRYLSFTQQGAREARDLLLALPCLYTPTAEGLPAIGEPVLIILKNSDKPLEAWRHSTTPEMFCSALGALYHNSAVEGWIGYPEVLR
jgi:hypothetical protein